MKLLQSLLLVVCSILIAAPAFAKSKNYADQPKVQEFINMMVKKHGFNKAELTKTMNQVKIRPQVMKRIKTPLEKKPWSFYQKLFITESHIKNGAKFWNANKKVLTQAQKKYGVPADIIVATIGIESKYGKHTGDYRVIDALANIGFSDNRRSKFFKYELEQFLLLVKEQKLDPLTVMGSYAGAIGQPQFMPSSYRRYAVSYNGKKSIDLSHNTNDIIFSIANYYKKKGWETSQPVATPASMVNINYAIYPSKHKKPKIVKKRTLTAYGNINKKKIKQPYKVIELKNRRGKEYWYTFENFRVIKRYNPSDLYAMAVFQLSTLLTDYQGKTKNA